MTTSIVDAIKKAKQSLEGLNLDDVEKQVAMSKAIDYYLLPNSNSQKKPTDKSNQLALQNAKDENDLDFWGNLSKASKLKEELIKDVYSFSKGFVNLVLTKVKGGDRKEQQVNFSALILYGYMVGLKQDWISPKTLAEAAKEFHLHDTNFSRTLSASTLFRTKGYRSGLQYKLSTSAIKQTEEYLKELCK